MGAFGRSLSVSLDDETTAARAERNPIRPPAWPVAAWVIWRVVSWCGFMLVGGKPIVGAARWDDGYYLTILRQGYRPFAGYGPYQQTNFFPLLSWITRAVQVVVRSESVATNLVVSAASLTTVVLLYVAAARWTSERTARYAVAVLLLSPASIFLWLYYSEGLFIALSIAALIAADRGQGGRAALLGVAVAMTRSVGVMIVVPLLLAQWRRGAEPRRMAIAFLPAVGLATVMAAQWIQAGDPLAFQRTSALWGRHTTAPWQPIIDRVHLTIVNGYFGVTFLADLGAVALCVFACVRAGRHGIPLAVRAWLVLMTFVPLVSGLMFSWSRYMLAAWPAAIVLGDLLAARPRAVRVVVFATMALVGAHRIFAWHHGSFVG